MRRSEAAETRREDHQSTLLVGLVWGHWDEFVRVLRPRLLWAKRLSCSVSQPTRRAMELPVWLLTVLRNCGSAIGVPSISRSFFQLMPEAWAS